jgi:muramoyltetrapeptide carboxypeptidase LdcA involved in peptidoglycan recycling
MLSELLKFKNGKKLDVAYPIEIRDSNGNVVYIEESDNLWIKYEYNSKGKITYCEDSNNYWSKTEYDDSNGKEEYYEDCRGIKIGTSKKKKNKEAQEKIKELEDKLKELKESIYEY